MKTRRLVIGVGLGVYQVGFGLLAGMMLMFWITLWFAAEIVSRRIQNPLASALFAALVQGWMFAAWFVTV